MPNPVRGARERHPGRYREARESGRWCRPDRERGPIPTAASTQHDHEDQPVGRQQPRRPADRVSAQTAEAAPRDGRQEDDETADDEEHVDRVADGSPGQLRDQILLTRRDQAGKDASGEAARPRGSPGPATSRIQGRPGCPTRPGLPCPDRKCWCSRLVSDPLTMRESRSAPAALPRLDLQVRASGPAVVDGRDPAATLGVPLHLHLEPLLCGAFPAGTVILIVFGTLKALLVDRSFTFRFFAATLPELWTFTVRTSFWPRLTVFLRDEARTSSISV